MKSSFLFLMLVGAMVTSQVYAKPNKILSTKTTTTTTAAPAVTPAPEVSKSAFDKFYERLGISYYGAVTSPPLKKWNSNYAATSPETTDTCKNCDSYSANIWNQVNFSYNYGGMFKFNVIPRFTVFLDTPSKQAQGERGMIMLEDALVGFSGVILSSPNKKFNWWMRPGVRLPTSHATRHGNNAEFGRTTYNVEVTNSFTYDFNKEFQLALSYQNRYWIYENRYNASRNRHYIAPNFTYAFNETTKLIGYYEVMIENTRRWKSINGQKPLYKDIWQNAYIGVGKDITPKLNVYPYLSAYVNDIPFSTRSFFLGAWISYTIK